jgi:hypothetical protein
MERKYDPLDIKLPPCVILERSYPAALQKKILQDAYGEIIFS